MPATQTPPPITIVGKPSPRVDGPLKVCGGAMYTSDHHFPGMLYGVPVPATIARGKIEKLDTAVAEKMPGVRAVFHRENIGKLFRPAVNKDFSADAVIIDETRPPLEDDVIRYYGQYVALAVADTFEQAEAAARAVKVTYSSEKPNVDPKLEAEKKPKVESERGDAEKAFADGAVKIDQTYVTPVETHNPIELHASVAVFDGTNYTLYETTQAVMNHRSVLAQILGVPKENVRVISKFLGSGFGGKLWPWTQSPLAAAAARNLKKPVKVVVSRKMMFQTCGHRPLTQQRVRLSASRDGKLTSLQHDYLTHTSIEDDYAENCGEATAYQYSVPNLRVTSGLVHRNVGTPTSMRGPGAVPGLYATESAMNELAVALKIDPVKLRMLNEPQIDEGLKLPFSSRHLLECFTLGMEKFGWSKRTPEVGSMKQDGLTLGWGMAGCSWIADRFASEVRVELRDDGTARVACGTQDIGTGTYTVLAQVAADKLGIPIEKVEVTLGDTTLPPGPVSGGSMVTASVIPSVIEAAGKVVDILLKTTVKQPGSKFEKQNPDNLAYDHGRVHVKGEPAESGVGFDAMLKESNIKSLSGYAKSEGTFGGKSKAKFSSHSFGAHFAEVTWQPQIARLRVSRVVTVIDAGRIVNPLAGRNQIEGAVVMGIGMALFEHTTYDQRNGAPINSNLADYIVATNADVPALDVHFLDYPDYNLNPLGARGIGEIGLAGIAAALTDAVYHATGVRVRELPVKIENLL
ncbi:MAG TPA: xanthine dehydrogenase family protein molybdopterin-binding subunit [Tepidisphaeraceae bacterium]|jgi:xanthine dehydrogenase YagR molybdenum-binding subunit|nr:xanthine dehydrogenase family protein molybdopterin-binding subunit [Tepidisphaeraceae bacterium]